MNFQSLLESFSRKISRHPRQILILAAIIMAFSVFFSLRLGVDNEIESLLPSDNIAAKSYVEITNEFASTSTLLTVIEGPNRDTLVEAGKVYLKAIKSDPRTAGLVRTAQLTVDRNFAEKWGFILQDAEDLADMKNILSTTRMIPLLRKTNDLIESKLSDGDDEEVKGAEGEDDSFAMMSQFGLFAIQLKKALETGDVASANELADAWTLGEEYMIDPEGKTLLLMVRPNFDIGDRQKLGALSEGAAAIGRETAANFSGVSFRFTGDVESEANEYRAINSDVFWPSIIAFSLIIVLFFFSFNRRRSILFPLISLTVGILADLAIAAVTVKNLNMITSSFGALLIGLGIDFGIHVVSRFDELTKEGRSAEDALVEVFAKTAAPVSIGAITTAMAFYALMLSQTIAFRQFGLVAGTGILTTLISSFTVLPALLALLPGKNVLEKKRTILRYGFSTSIASFSSKHRVPVLSLCAVLTIIAIFMIPKNGFDYDMRKIGPQHTDAMETENIVAERYGLSTWQHLAIANSVEEARKLQEAFKSAPLVRRVESIADYIPSNEDQDASLAITAEIRAQKNRTAGESWNEKSVTELTEEIQRLEWNMIELGDLAAASLGENALPVRKRNAMIREVFGNETGKTGAEVFSSLITSIESLPPDEAATRLGTIDDAFSSALDEKITRMATIDRRIGISDLPEDAKVDLVNGDKNKFLVIIQPSASMSGDDNFERFTKGLQDIDPRATGTLTLGFELSREVLSEAGKMALIVAFIIVLVVWLGFLKAKPTIACVLAFLCAFLWLFGISPLIGKFNIVNALSIPLIIGVGIDYCVHIMTALRESGDVKAALGKTGKAVTLSMLTTLIGFGSLALVGQYKGIADLGKTLSVGIICCYIVAIVIVPAIAAPSTLHKEGKEPS
jgi:predicted RND superfamily exporter protein